MRREHPLVRATARSLRAAQPTDQGFLIPAAQGAFNAVVGPGSIDRVLALLQALVDELAKQDITLRVDRANRKSLALVDGEKLAIAVVEQRARRRHTPTPEEGAEAANPWGTRIPEWDYYPSGVLALIIDEHIRGVRRRFAEGKRGPLETRLDRFVPCLRRAAAAKRETRLERERWAREQEEEDRRKAEEDRRRAEERHRREALFAEVEAWRSATALREYLRVVEAESRARGGPSEAEAEWLSWASGVADTLVPPRVRAAGPAAEP